MIQNSLIPIMKRIISALIVIAVFAGAYYVLSTRDQEAASAQITATIFPVADIAQEIAGDDYVVQTLIPSGTSPHQFEPTPSTLRSLQSAEVTYAIGNEFDEWVIEMAESNSVEVVTVDEGIFLLESEGHDDDSHDEEEHEEAGHEDEHEDADHDDHEHEGEEHNADHDGHDHEDAHEDENEHEDHDEEGHDDHAHDHAHGEFDPHYWLSIPNAKIIASTIADDLSERFPESSEMFESNLEQYLVELDETNEEITEMLSGLENRSIVTFHDAWYYFGKAYDLEILGTFVPTAGREPTPQYLADLSELLEQAGTTTIYSEPQLSTESIQGFSEDLNLNVATIDPIGGSEKDDSYINLMKRNAKTIKNNQ